MENLLITIFGVGCAKHRSLLDNLQIAINDHGLEAAITEIYDVDSFLENGITEVPCLVVNGEVIVRGSAPNPIELVKLLMGD